MGLPFALGITGRAQLTRSRTREQEVTRSEMRVAAKEFATETAVRGTVELA
jgi:hypothetical protein